MPVNVGQSAGPTFAVALQQRALGGPLDQIQAEIASDLGAARRLLNERLSEFAANVYARGVQDGFVQGVLADLDSEQQRELLRSVASTTSGEGAPAAGAREEGSLAERLPASIKAGARPAPGKASAEHLRRLERYRARYPGQFAKELGDRKLEELGVDEADALLKAMRQVDATRGSR